LLWALVMGGAALRLSLIAGQHFHGDEAIYGYWAQLIAFGQDPLLLSVPLDKPPLFIYLLAGVFELFGPTEVAARLISEVASLAAVGLVYELGRRLYGRPVALLAAGVMALSPFNVLFAPTAFTDPLMVVLILIALNLAAASRWGWAGVTVGLAVATKQQGILFAPLVAATGWIAARCGRPSPSAGPWSFVSGPWYFVPGTKWTKGSGHGLLASTRQAPGPLGPQAQAPGPLAQGQRGLRVWAQGPKAATSRIWGVVRMGLGFLSVMLLLTGWDALRWRVRASFWEQSTVSHGPLHLVNWWELGERLAGWSDLLGYVFGSPVLNAIVLLGVPLLLWRGRRAVLAAGNGSEAYRNQAGGAGLALSQRSPGFYVRPARTDWLLAGFSALFVLAHWLLSFSVWDRYLLGLVPLIALLLARVVWQAAVRAGIKRAGLVGLALAILLTGPAVEAVRGDYPIGGDHGAYQGLEKVIAFFRHEVVANSVVWHRYLGWHYFHYLFGAPLDLRWYTGPAVLATKASLETDAPNYVAFPAWKEAAEAEARAALAAVDLSLMEERRVRRGDGRLAFTIYRIVVKDAQPGVTWASENP